MFKTPDIDLEELLNYVDTFQDKNINYNWILD